MPAMADHNGDRIVITHFVNKFVYKKKKQQFLCAKQ